MQVALAACLADGLVLTDAGCCNVGRRMQVEDGNLLPSVAVGADEAGRRESSICCIVLCMRGGRGLLLEICMRVLRFLLHEILAWWHFSKCMYDGWT